MQCIIEVADYKNITSSQLIERNLFTQLKIGNRVFRSQQGVKFSCTFQLSASTETACIISLENKQTGSAMYSREIPFTVVSDRREWRSWVEVYLPSDSRSQKIYFPTPEPVSAQLDIKVEVERPLGIKAKTLGNLQDALREERHSMPATIHRDRDVLEAQWMAEHIQRSMNQANAVANNQNQTQGELQSLKEAENSLREQLQQARESENALKEKYDAAMSREKQINEERDRLRQAIERGQDEFQGQTMKLQSHLQSVTTELEQSRSERTTELEKQDEQMQNYQRKVRTLEKKLEDAEKRSQEAIAREVDLERTLVVVQNTVSSKDTTTKELEGEIQRLRRQTQEKEESLAQNKTQFFQTEQQMKNDLQKAENEYSEKESKMEVELRRVRLEAQQKETSLHDELQDTKRVLMEREKSLTEDVRAVKTELLQSEHHSSEELQRVKSEFMKRSSQLEEQLRQVDGERKTREGQLIADLDQSRNTMSGLEFNLRQEIEQHKRRHDELLEQIEHRREEAELNKDKWEKELEVTRVNYRGQEEQLEKELAAAKEDLKSKRNELLALQDEATNRASHLQEVAEESQQQEKVLESARKSLEVARAASQGWEQKYELQQSEHAKLLAQFEEKLDAKDEREKEAQIRESIYSEKVEELQAEHESLQKELTDALERTKLFDFEKAALEGKFDEAQYNLNEKSRINIELLNQVKELKQKEDTIEDTLSETRRDKSEKDAAIHQLTLNVRDANERANKLEAAIREKETEITKVSSDLANKNALCHGMEMDLTERKTQHERINLELTQKVETIEKLEAKLLARQQALEHVESSTADLSRTAATAENLQSMVEKMESRIKELEIEQEGKSQLLTKATDSLDCTQKALKESEMDILARNEKVKNLEEEKNVLSEKVLNAVQHKDAVANELLQTQQQFDDLRREKEELEQEQNALTNKLGDMTLREDDQSNRLRELSAELKANNEANMYQEAENNIIRSSVTELQSQLNSLQIEKDKYNEHLQRQHENFGLQSSITDDYLERLEKSEHEASLLAEGLQEAEEKLKWLTKENKIIIQQIEKKYDGSINEWAADIQNMKNMGRDEAYWRQKADTAEELSQTLHLRLQELELSMSAQHGNSPVPESPSTYGRPTNGLMKHSIQNGAGSLSRFNSFVGNAGGLATGHQRATLPNPGSNGQSLLTSQPIQSPAQAFAPQQRQWGVYPPAR